MIIHEEQECLIPEPLADLDASRIVGLIELLLKHGANPDPKSVKGESVLYLAAKRGDLKIVEQLLEAGAKPDQTTKEGRSPALVAASFDKIRVAERLVEAGAGGVISGVDTW